MLLAISSKVKIYLENMMYVSRNISKLVDKCTPVWSIYTLHMHSL